MDKLLKIIRKRRDCSLNSYKAIYVRRQGKEKPLIEHRCYFLNLISFLILVVIFLKKSRYFSLRQKLNHLLAALFGLRLEKQASCSQLAASEPEVPQRCGAMPAGPRWGGCVASTCGSGPHLCEGCPDHYVKEAPTRWSMALQANSTEHKGQGPGHTRS